MGEDVKTKTMPTGVNHEAFAADVRQLLDRHSGPLPADAMLSLAAYLTGQILAFQDQRSMTPEMAMHLVKENMEAGNKSVIDNLQKTQGEA